MKVSIIGAGNVGATLAERIISHEIADVVLVDVVGGLAAGKALDLTDAAPVMGYDSKIAGTDDYSKIKNSDIIVITAGLARKPGMSRDDLIAKNSAIIRAVVMGIKKFSPGSIVIVVTNPLDIMTYLAYGELECERSRVLGMAGNLDAARFKALIAEKLAVSPKEIEAYVLGSHGDTMVPIVSESKVSGKPLSGAVDPGALKQLIERTKKRGGEIVGLLKSGSAYFSPSASVFEIVKAVKNDEKRVIPCSCVTEGEYGLSGCAIGVPAKIGKSGIEKIVEWKLDREESEALAASAAAVKEVLVRR